MLTIFLVLCSVIGNLLAIELIVVVAAIGEKIRGEDQGKEDE